MITCDRPCKRFQIPLQQWFLRGENVGVGSLACRTLLDGGCVLPVWFDATYSYRSGMRAVELPHGPVTPPVPT
jgi:hypothetical protein